MWSTKTTECTNTFKALGGSSGANLSVNSVHLQPKTTDNIVVCNKSNTIVLMNLQGQVNLAQLDSKRCLNDVFYRSLGRLRLENEKAEIS